MDARRLTELLHGQQDAVLAHLAGSAQLVNAGGIEAIGALARARWEALRLVRGYQLFKHVELFDPMIAGGTPEQRAMAERMKQRCIESMQQFVDHVTMWSMAEAVAEWDRYRLAVTALVKDMRAGLMAERRDAERLLAGVGKVRMMNRMRLPGDHKRLAASG